MEAAKPLPGPGPSQALPPLCLECRITFCCFFRFRSPFKMLLLNQASPILQYKLAYPHPLFLTSVLKLIVIYIFLYVLKLHINIWALHLVMQGWRPLLESSSMEAGAFPTGQLPEVSIWLSTEVIQETNSGTQDTPLKGQIQTLGSPCPKEIP